MPLAFICIGKEYHKNDQKILGIGKAIKVFETLLLWQFEGSVYIFKGP